MPIHYQRDPNTGNVLVRDAKGKPFGQWLAKDVTAVPGQRRYRVQRAKMKPIKGEDSRLGEETPNTNT